MGQVILNPATLTKPAPFQDGVSVGYLAPATISNVAVTSDVATITTSSAHGFQQNQWVIISGLSHTALNAVNNAAVQIASVPSTTTFTFAIVTGNISSTSDSGTATQAQIVATGSSTSNQAQMGWGGPNGNQFFGGTGAGMDFICEGVVAMRLYYAGTAVLTLPAGSGFGGIGTYSLSASPYLLSAGSPDISMFRIANNVWSIGAGSNSGVGWLQLSAGEWTLASNFTNATATMASTNIAPTLLAGRSYRVTGYLIVSNSVAGEGCQFDFNGGNATVTAMDISFMPLTPANVVVGSNTAQATTALSTTVNFSTITGTNRIFVSGYAKINTGGTFTLRSAENTHSTGTFTLAAGSWLAFNDTVNY